MANERETSPLGHPMGQMQSDVWTRKPDSRFALKLAIGSGTADAAMLYTVPTGKRLLIERTLFEVTTAFTGGTASAIGLSSSQAPHETKGDLLGGSGGDVAATLVAGVTGGTIGASFGSNGVVLLEAGATILFDRITSAFTAGAGFVHVVGQVVD